MSALHYISLGYFCSVAEELEKLGLRTESSPFDWTLTKFEGVIEAVENHFEGYLDYDSLYQNERFRGRYKNIEYGVEYVHDFSAYLPLKDQLSAVQQKYSRRIERFYQSISEPTVFIRYISDEETIDGVSAELLWIEKNYDRIIKLIKRFNEENKIVFIANQGMVSKLFEIYTVQKSENDTVCRQPFQNNSVLYRKFTEVSFDGREQNIKRYKDKVKRQRSFITRIRNKMLKFYRTHFLKEYIHDKQI